MEDIAENPKEKGRMYRVYMVQRQIGEGAWWVNIMTFAQRADAEAYAAECDMISTVYPKQYRVTEELLKL